MKKLIFVTQSKGGAGKSVYTFLLAEKYPNAIILDMDDATKTTTLQLAYRNPLPITFLNSNSTIDRGLFNNFLEEIYELDQDLFIADLGASISEQLPFYFSDMRGTLSSILEELKIELEIHNIIGGENIFVQTMSYLDELQKSINKQITIKILKNEYYEYNNDQNETLKKYAEKHKLEIVPFTISRDKNPSTQSRIKEVMKSGQGIQAAGIISRAYFKNAIAALSL